MTQIKSDPCHPRKFVASKLQKNSEYSSRLGEPVPALVTWFVVEPLTIALRVVVAEAPGLNCLYSAATPATCGEAIEVPLNVAVAVSELKYDDRIPEPGAKMSTHVPKFENEERASLVVVEPVVMALAARAGDCVQASVLLLPAATAIGTPEFARLLTAVSRALDAPPPRLMLATAGLM